MLGSYFNGLVGCVSSFNAFVFYLIDLEWKLGFTTAFSTFIVQDPNTEMQLNVSCSYSNFTKNNSIELYQKFECKLPKWLFLVLSSIAFFSFNS